MAKKITVYRIDAEFHEVYTSKKEAMADLMSSLEEGSEYECEVCGARYNTEQKANCCCDEVWYLGELAKAEDKYNHWLARNQNAEQFVKAAMHAPVSKWAHHLGLCQARVAKHKERVNE
jgi:hypothetical protein